MTPDCLLAYIFQTGLECEHAKSGLMREQAKISGLMCEQTKQSGLVCEPFSDVACFQQCITIFIDNTTIHHHIYQKMFDQYAYFLSIRECKTLSMQSNKVI